MFCSKEKMRSTLYNCTLGGSSLGCLNWKAHLTDSNRKVSRWPSTALAFSSHSSALLPHSREVNLKGSSSLLCVGACICESPAWFTVDGTVQEMLMQGAWDCFKAVKRDQSPEDDVNLGYCALLPDECGRHRDEDNRSPAIFSLLWWMRYKNPTQPWMDFPKFKPSAVLVLYHHFRRVYFVETDQKIMFMFTRDDTSFSIRLPFALSRCVKGRQWLNTGSPEPIYRAIIVLFLQFKRFLSPWNRYLK